MTHMPMHQYGKVLADIAHTQHLLTGAVRMPNGVDPTNEKDDAHAILMAMARALRHATLEDATYNAPTSLAKGYRAKDVNNVKNLGLLGSFKSAHEGRNQIKKASYNQLNESNYLTEGAGDLFGCIPQGQKFDGLRASLAASVGFSVEDMQESPTYFARAVWLKEALLRDPEAVDCVKSLTFLRSQMMQDAANEALIAKISGTLKQMKKDEKKNTPQYKTQQEQLKALQAQQTIEADLHFRAHYPGMMASERQRLMNRAIMVGGVNSLLSDEDLPVLTEKIVDALLTPPDMKQAMKMDRKNLRKTWQFPDEPALPILMANVKKFEVLEKHRLFHLCSEAEMAALTAVKAEITAYIRGKEELLTAKGVEELQGAVAQIAARDREGLNIKSGEDYLKEGLRILTKGITPNQAATLFGDVPAQFFKKDKLQEFAYAAQVPHLVESMQQTASLGIATPLADLQVVADRVAVLQYRQRLMEGPAQGHAAALNNERSLDALAAPFSDAAHAVLGRVMDIANIPDEFHEAAIQAGIAYLQDTAQYNMVVAMEGQENAVDSLSPQEITTHAQEMLAKIQQDCQKQGITLSREHASPSGGRAQR